MRNLRVILRTAVYPDVVLPRVEAEGRTEDTEQVTWARREVEAIWVFTRRDVAKGSLVIHGVNRPPNRTQKTIWALRNQTSTALLKQLSKLFFWMMEICADGTFFYLHRRKWICDVTGTNTILDVEAGNRKLGLFWRRLWEERTAQKGAPRLTAENHVVWRNFPLNRKFLNGWLRTWWSSIRYPLSIAESSCQKEIF